MRLLIISFVLLCHSPNYTFAQEANLSEADKRAEHTPFWVNYNTQSLSKYLTQNCTSDEEKVRSIYIWITEHIKYDAKRYQRNISKNQTPQKTLLRRKALCAQYAELFKTLCGHAGITTLVVEGYLKGTGYKPDDLFFHADHAWNIVQLDSNRYLIDLTLASGNLYLAPYLKERLAAIFTRKPLTKSKLKYRKKRNDEYYKNHPQYFVNSHLPIVKEFQLLSEPLSVEDFENNKRRFFIPEALNKKTAVDQTFTDLIAGDPSAFIALADSALVFNCRNVLAHAELYSTAASQTLIKSRGTVNIEQLKESIQYLDSSNKSLPEAKVMIAEEAYYKTQKNRYRNALCTFYLTQANKANKTVKSIGTIDASNKRKIKSLKKQNRLANKLIRSYARKDISRIKTKSGMSLEKANSIISHNNELITKNASAVMAKTTSIDSSYLMISNDNIQSLDLNQQHISVLLTTIHQLSIASGSLRFNHHDNLDEDIKQNNTLRYSIIDTLNAILRKRKPLLDTIRLNNKAITKRMTEIKALSARNITLMKKNKRLGYYDASQFTKSKQDAIKALNMIVQKNNSLIAFTKQETQWGYHLLKQSKRLSTALYEEGIYEETRYQFRALYIDGNRNRLQKQCALILKTNLYTKKVVRKLVSQ